MATLLAGRGGGHPPAALALGFLLPCVVMSPPAGAQTAAEPTFNGCVTDTVFVTAEAIDAIAASTVVTRISLEQTRGGADAAELLATVAGLQMRRYGAAGAPALLSVRGSSGAQVQVLIDGLPLADAQNGAVDLTSLPLERFAAAEIHRGLVPAGAGGLDAAGAVNLISRDDLRGGAEVRLYGGSLGSAGGRASYSAATADGAWRAFVLAHGRRADNRFAYLDHNQTFATAGDDTVRERRNAQLAEFGWYGLGEATGAAGTLRASAGFFRQDAGRPGPLGFPSPQAVLRRDRWDARLTAADRRRRLTVDVAGNHSVHWLHDPDGEVGWDPPGSTEARGDDLTGRILWAPTWTLDAGTVAATAGGSWRGEWYQETASGQPRPWRKRMTVAALASLTLELPAPRLSLTPGWRWQRARDDFPPVPPMPWLPDGPAEIHRQDAVSPSVAGSWGIVPGRVVLQGRWHETVRPPTWVELFGQPGGLEGNRALQPEAITGRDASLVLASGAGAARLRATVFDQITERTITWLQSSLYTVKPANIGRTRTRGLEIELRFEPSPGLEVAANLTRQDARDRGPDAAYRGKPLPYLPATEAALRVGLTRGDWQPTLAVTHASSNPRDRYDQPEQRAPARTLVDLALARTWRGGAGGAGHALTSTIEIVNLTDNAVYDVEGFPLPGRSFRVSLYWR